MAINSRTNWLFFCSIFLDLIAIDYLKNKDDYEINLIFDNNAYIALTTETIEVRLEDQNETEE